SSDLSAPEAPSVRQIDKVHRTDEGLGPPVQLRGSERRRGHMPQSRPRTRATASAAGGSPSSAGESSAAASSGGRVGREGCPATGVAPQGPSSKRETFSLQT